MSDAGGFVLVSFCYLVLRRLLQIAAMRVRKRLQARLGQSLQGRAVRRYFSFWSIARAFAFVATAQLFVLLKVRSVNPILGSMGINFALLERRSQEPKELRLRRLF
jgi:hypothetical protein